MRLDFEEVLEEGMCDKTKFLKFMRILKRTDDVLVPRAHVDLHVQIS